MESVFCAGGIHGLRTSVCGKGNGLFPLTTTRQPGGLCSGDHTMCGRFAQGLNKPVARTLEINSGDLVLIPDSVTRVSFGISFNPCFL